MSINNNQEDKMNLMLNKMDIKLTTHFDRNVKLMKPGQMTHVLINVNNKSEYCFLIKEESPYLKSITYNPVISQGMVHFDVDGVIVIVHMIKANNNENTLYETWLNYYNKIDGCYSDVDMFANQESIRIIIVNTSGEIVKIYEERNKYKEFYEMFRDIIKNSEPWTMQDYNACKLGLSLKFPSITSLWEYMRS